MSISYEDILTMYNGSDPSEDREGDIIYLRQQLLDYCIRNSRYYSHAINGNYYRIRIGWSGPGSLVEALGGIVQYCEKKGNRTDLIFEEQNFVAQVDTKGEDCMPQLYDFYTKQVWGREDKEIEEVNIMVWDTEDLEKRREYLPRWLRERWVLRGEADRRKWKKEAPKKRKLERVSTSWRSCLTHTIQSGPLGHEYASANRYFGGGGCDACKRSDLFKGLDSLIGEYTIEAIPAYLTSFQDGYESCEERISLTTSKGVYNLRRHHALNSYHGAINGIKVRIVLRENKATLTYWY